MSDSTTFYPCSNSLSNKVLNSSIRTILPSLLINTFSFFSKVLLFCIHSFFCVTNDVPNDYFTFRFLTLTVKTLTPTIPRLDPTKEVETEVWVTIGSDLLVVSTLVVDVVPCWVVEQL